MYPTSPQKSGERRPVLPPLDQYVRVTPGGRTALVHPDFAREVADALLDGVGCEPAGVGGRGTLLRFPYAQGTGMIRRYRRGGAIRWLLRERYLFVNRPLRELRVHHAAFNEGLPVPMPLGVMWERRGPYYRGAIATEELAAVTLRDATEQPNADAALRNAGAAVRRMHDAGLDHADLQVRNVLVDTDNAFIIDLDNAQWRTMTPARRLNNLRRLLRSFQREGIDNDAFWKLYEGYGREDGIKRDLRVRAAKEVRPRSYAWAEEAQVHVAEGVDAADARAALTRVSHVLKVSPKSTTYRSGKWVIKASPAEFSPETLRLFAGLNRYRRAYHAIQRLQSHGVPVPKVVAYVEARRWGRPVRAAVITDYLAGWVNVEEHARALIRERADDGTIGAYLARIAAAVRGLEHGGAYHGDLSGKNILTERGERFAFIDLDGIAFPRRISEADRLKTHIQLYDSFCDYWSDRLLRPFIDALWLEDAAPPEDWFERVRMGQAVRRARQQARWRKQGVAPPQHLGTRD